MLSALSKVWKNKIFAVIILLIIITLPTTIYRQSDKDYTIVASSIGIERKDDKYEVTILAVIPKGENDINSNLEIFSAEGDTISSALDKITLDIGRKIGLAHCDCIIFTEELMEKNLTQILDYFIRTANLSTNPTLIATPDSARDLLTAVKTSNNLLDLSLKNIINSQEDRTLLHNVTIDRFYRAYYSPNSTFTIPILSVKDESSQGGSGSSSSNTPQGDSQSGSESSSGGGGEKKKISNEGEVAVLRDGKFLATLTEDEKFIYNLVTNPGEYQKFILDNINDEHFINSKVVFQEADKIIFPLCKYEDDKPVMEYNIWLSLMIDEVSSEDNHSYASTSGTQNLLTDTVKEEIHKLVDERLAKTNTLMQEKHYDILNLYEKFDAFTYRKFHKYISSLEDSTEYMSGISIKINLNLNYVI